MQLTKQEKTFVDTVWDYFSQYQRAHLPWRQTTDPYHILVSELMLQQTQVDRVIPKYEAFIERWPTVADLARATLGEVLIAWQGLGYNRRAKFLHQAAQVLHADLDDTFPSTETALQSLPGIGQYTAAAIVVFAFNKRAILIETNIRQVVIFHFFKTKMTVSEAQIHKVIERTLPDTNYRDWYAALMDYGSYLKKEHGNLNNRSNRYTKQSTFRGSDREVRGALLRALSHQGKSRAAIVQELPFTEKKILAQLERLQTEGLIEKRARRYRLPQ
jgi:A/G-specific adenine glycosylase